MPCFFQKLINMFKHLEDFIALKHFKEHCEIAKAGFCSEATHASVGACRGGSPHLIEQFHLKLRLKGKEGENQGIKFFRWILVWSSGH